MANKYPTFRDFLYKCKLFPTEHQGDHEYVSPDGLKSVSIYDGFNQINVGVIDYKGEFHPKLQLVYKYGDNDSVGICPFDLDGYKRMEDVYYISRDESIWTQHKFITPESAITMIEFCGREVSKSERTRMINSKKRLY